MQDNEILFKEKEADSFEILYKTSIWFVPAIAVFNLFISLVNENKNLNYWYFNILLTILIVWPLWYIFNEIQKIDKLYKQVLLSIYLILVFCLLILIFKEITLAFIQNFKKY